MSSPHVAFRATISPSVFSPSPRSTDPSYQAITLSLHNFFPPFLGNIPFASVMLLLEELYCLRHTHPLLLFLDNIPPLFPTPYHRINDGRGDLLFPLVALYISLISILSATSHHFVDFSCQSSKVFLQRNPPPFEGSADNQLYK
jgi:hypothetical protein